MNGAAIKDLLRERNPWWRDAQAWRPTDRVLRDADDAPFVYAPDALDGIAPPNLYVLTGPRRVGKSVAMRRKIQELLESGEDPRSIVYCSCDGYRPQDLRRLFKAGRALMPAAHDRPMWWFIDEVTAVGEDWGTVVKSLRDDTALRGDCVVLRLLGHRACARPSMRSQDGAVPMPPGVIGCCCRWGSGASVSTPVSTRRRWNDPSAWLT